ncbi:cysteine dioxygenase [Vibrio maritimus]|uniref:cysteine dioxygenase n=1 Tax=Vibrio maritimus TaxID=990268 RepID=UPI003734EAF2
MTSRTKKTSSALTKSTDFSHTEKLTAQLKIEGQGVVAVSAERDGDLTFLEFCFGINKRAMKLSVTNISTTLQGLDSSGEWVILTSSESVIDRDPQCQYWISVDGNNAVVRYGKGEIRGDTVLLEYGIEHDELYLKGSDIDHESQSWLKRVKTIDILASDNRLEQRILQDPVTIDPPLFVTKIEEISMDEIAFHHKTVAANLTPACQQLYANISGKSFVLNTEAFPEFEQAINESINDVNGWCYQTLQSKAGEFGQDAPKETYLRITMGVNQGESPGIPYVMEIWPCGHYSPIHNHGDANAIIRVLSGEITVHLFAMLSKYHDDPKPFASQSFITDEVTWLSPGLNQIHQLRNEATDGRACITIQCYQYSHNNTQHYEYFDYLNPTERTIEQFTPNSDMGFLEFKAKMWQEWRERHGK